MDLTQQMKVWNGEFGKEYTDRNPQTVESLNFIYKNRYGVTRTAMNADFLGGLPKDIKILEVGCNVGTQLKCLQQIGLKNLHGIELQPYAVGLSKELTKDINIIEGSAFDIPFENESFDLVFTSGLLIHISPKDIDNVLDEIYRCSKKYIWGFEYYSKDWLVINYREKDDLLWKADYCQLFMDRFSTLEIIKKQLFKYKDNDNQDKMFLLKKEN